MTLRIYALSVHPREGDGDVYVESAHKTIEGARAARDKWKAGPQKRGMGFCMVHPIDVKDD